MSAKFLYSLQNLEYPFWFMLIYFIIDDNFFSPLWRLHSPSTYDFLCHFWAREVFTAVSLSWHAVSIALCHLFIWIFLCYWINLDGNHGCALISLFPIQELICNKLLIIYVGFMRENFSSDHMHQQSHTQSDDQTVILAHLSFITSYNINNLSALLFPIISNMLNL